MIPDSIKFKAQEVWSAVVSSETVEKLRTAYDGLPEREQLIVKISAAAIMLFIFFNIIYSVLAMISEREDVIKEMAVISRELDELDDLIKKSKTQMRKMKKLSMETKYISLLDIVERQQTAAMIKPASRIDLKESPRKEVEGGKYYENTANVQYNKITIRQLSRLLFGIEQNGISTKISSLKIKTRFDDDRYIDVEFEVVARTPK
ncbi:MAG: hypothetical protein JXA66_01630 [Oligoflexia bacterium]|nr:hypothetical protein [Oligoflexia bacterium]